MMPGTHAPTPPLRIRGVSWLDTATGESRTRDLFIQDGVILAGDSSAGRTLDGSGLHAMFGLWDSHAHAGGLMYDPDATGYFEAVPDRTIRAGESFREAVEMGVTGVRCVDVPDDLDLAWGRAYAAGTSLGPRVTGAGRGIRTTGGHGTAFPRVYTQMGAELVVDGPDAMARAVRRQVERGAQWVKIMLTGGLYSPFEAADEGQFTEAELTTLMDVANQRHIPVAAHSGQGGELVPESLQVGFIVSQPDSLQDRQCLPQLARSWRKGRRGCLQLCGADVGRQ